MKFNRVLLSIVGMIGFWGTAAQGQATDAEIQARVNALIARMTPQEKAAQLSGIGPTDLLVDGHFSLDACEKKIPYGIGHISQYASGTTLRPDQLVQFAHDVQQFLREKTRLGIPAILHDECITGMPARGATIFPQQIGMSCTWDTELLRGNTKTTSRSMRLGGATQCLSPMLDVLDDARWGRGEEGFGEDPYLVSLMGLNFIQGMQGADLRSGIACTSKHFAGYGGQNDDMGLFRDDVLMPHEVAVRLGHVACVMPGYHEFQNVPCAASHFLLEDTLRKAWGFDGVVVSDYGAVPEVVTRYKFAADTTEAVRDCLQAGLDVDLPKGEAFAVIPKALTDGSIPVSVVDRSVRRILTLKIKLGLLDSADADAEPLVPDFNPPAYQKRAYQSACESLVLLKNDGILPLQNIHSVAVVGPSADSYYALLGDYTYPMLNEFWRRKRVDTSSPKLVTLLAGLHDRLGSDVKINYERGCDWSGPLDASDVKSPPVGGPAAGKAKKKPLEKIPATDAQRALKIAAESDVIVAAMGENRYLCGETCNRDDVRLPGDQEEFVKRLIATGKPVILVVFGGRPMALTDIAAGCRAIVYAWYPGQDGGDAVADLLLGNINPSGKLTVTLARSNAQTPTSYRRGYKADDMPLYPFGYGLSYTTFGYANLACPAAVSMTDKKIPIQFNLSNTGHRQGTEIAQLYFVPHNRVAPQPVMQLKGFARVDIDPGQSKTISIDVFPQELAHYDEAGTLKLEPGAYDVLIGASSTDIRLRSVLTLTGDPVTLAQREQFFSETTVH